MLVAKFGASKKAIEDAAWASGRGTMGKHYCVVSQPLCVYCLLSILLSHKLHMLDSTVYTRLQ